MRSNTRVKGTPTLNEEHRKLMSASVAARKLEDILKWKNQLHPNYRTVQAIRYDHDRVTGGGEPGLDFGLDHVIDTSWSDGPDGTCTREGVDKWLRFWNPWFSYWAGLPHVYRPEPGPLFLQQLQENRVFQTVDAWDEDDQNAWEEFTTELTTMWARLRSLTGHKPLRRSLCPRCRKGNLESPPLRDGYTDQAACSNRDCALVVDYTKAEHAASVRAALRQATVDTWLTIEQVKTIWPDIRTGTLRMRAKNGHVRKQGRLYNLADINTWKLRLPTDIIDA